VNFVSYSFAALFLVVFACRLTFGRRKVEKPYLAVLLVSSLVFYSWHVPGYLVVLLASAIVDYVAALALARRAESSHSGRRWILAVSLATNLGLLGFFKYTNFALQTVERVADAAGLRPAIPTFDLLLPMGISFYTFHSMSYTIDVYRGRLQPLANFWSFLLYISFFPQLVAGPIVRAVDFLPQLPRVRRVRLQVINEGLFLLTGGLFLKMVCADNIAVFVNTHWDAGYEAGANSVTLLWLAMMFGAQIFCDFAGYSNIARGLALLLGFRLPVNFNAPYIAGSFKNFWERWHITLSSWLRDYLYVSLGGNRVSRVRTYINLMTVMVLGGLWHGAAWTFVVWGALHGGALAVERALGLHRGNVPVAVRMVWWGVVQLVVLVAWIFFRSDDVAGAFQFVRNIAALEWAAPNDVIRFGSWFLVPPIAMHAWRLLEEQHRVPAVAGYGKAALTGFFVFFLLTAYGPTNAFIYFQF
jgi:D-alanyl-lipoteichoic acid acyltransferase DltB (MBOAT superfamily)